ncbi:MAG: tail fiber domain-containing protein [Phycisphaeraceae bacterium]|nr:tail fiber domain-containing protein [Phycisphaeraceae bacterium]
MTHTTIILTTLALAATTLLPAPAVRADDPGHDAVTYQGQLRHDGSAVAGPVDLTFRLYDAATGGRQVGEELLAGGFADFDAEGRFTLDLQFGKSTFDGTQLWLEIQVDDTVLSPRQPIRPAPYSIRALDVAAVSDGALAGAYSGALQMTNPFNMFSGSFSGSGAGLTALDAAHVSTGNLSSARMPTGGPWTLASSLDVNAGTFFISSASSHVGIGTDAPASRLHVVDTGSVAMSVESSSVIGTWLNLRNTSAGGKFWRLISTGSGNGEGAGRLLIGHGATAGSQVTRMTLDDSGNVGIGTTSPLARLHVQGQLHLAGTGQDITWPAAEALQFGQWDGTAFTERARITSTGNVGIGTASPTNRLSVDGDANVTGSLTAASFSGSGAALSSLHAGNISTGTLSVNRMPTGGTWSLSNTLNIAGTADPLIHAWTTGAIVQRLVSPHSFGTQLLLTNVSTGGTTWSVISAGEVHGAGKLVFQNGALVRLAIQPDGNVGIGTSSPTDKLCVDPNGSGGIVIGTPEITDGGRSALVLRVKGASNAHSSIQAIRSAGSQYGNLLLNESGGNVGIGVSVASYLLHVGGDAAKPGGGSWSVASDARLKTGVDDLHGSLDALLALRGVSFEYIDPESISELPGRQVGFIAQEVEQVFPQWVDEAGDGYKRLTIRGFEAIAVEALRELRAEKDAQIEAQQAQIEAQQSDIEALREEIARLRHVVHEMISNQKERVR